MPTNAEDLSLIERAGRRCAVCQSGRGWRRFQLVRAAGREPVVLCGSCRARFGDDPPVSRPPAPAPSPGLSPAPSPAPEPAGGRSASSRKPRGDERRGDRRPDRLQAALRKLPGSFSTAMAARAAGLNHDKTLARLTELERRGEVRRVGNRWSTEQPPDALASAMDRLEARTTNLRIVRGRGG